MARTFKEYYEANQDVTSFRSPSPSDGLTNNKSFEQMVDPLVTSFVQQVQNTVLDNYTPRLNPSQIEYVLKLLKSKLGNIQYTQNDLGSQINNIWRAGNSVQTPRPATTNQGV